MGLPVMPLDLQQQRKQYRAPFKVHFVEWNPYSDLLALASRKGEVMVKRSMWKRCWKLNVSEVTAFPETQCSKPACIESMIWSPDGAVLAVAMNDGHLHLIEAEQGVIRWSRRICAFQFLNTPLRKKCCVGNAVKRSTLGQNTCAQQMRWFWSGTPPAPKSRLKCGWELEDEMKAVASIFGNGDIVDERLGKTLLYEILYLKTLRGTILFMIRNDFVVVALAGGILPVCEIRLMDKIAHLKLDVINIYDVLYTSRDGLTLAVTDYGPRPKLDEFDRDPIFTRSCARLSGEGMVDPSSGENIHIEKKFGSPSFMADAINCPHTHLINISFKLENESLLWEILLRYLKMYTCLVHFTYSMELSKKDWDSESKIFANRLNSTPNDLHLGDALINCLLGGAPGPLAERWLERTLGPAGVQSMKEFVDKRFSALVSFVRGQLSAAARSLAFQMDQYGELIREMQEENTTYESLITPSWSASGRVAEHSTPNSARIPDVTADHVFDALDPVTSSFILDRLHSGGVRIQAKCQEMVQAATANMRELSQLVRWMSLLPPLVKGSKRSTLHLEQTSKWDVDSLLKYLVETFTDGEERELLRRVISKIDNVFEDSPIKGTSDSFHNDKRTLSELLSSGRKECNDSATVSKYVSSETATPHVNTSTLTQKDYALDKVSTYWAEGLSDDAKTLLGDRFRFEDDEDTSSLKDKSLYDVLKEVTEIVQAASLLIIQSDTNVKLRWMYELASDATHCGFDSVRLSVFQWSNPKDMDILERKLLEMKGRDLEGSICVSSVCRDGLTCECLLPQGIGKLRAGVQPEMTISVQMQPGGFVETTPVQNEMGVCSKTDQVEGRLHLVIDENAVFGHITKFMSVEMYSGGHAYALATFKSEAGEMNRIMRKHPLMEAWFVHSGMTSEASESICLSKDRQQGCVVSEEGTRVALFRVQNSSAEEPQPALLTSVPAHRPALQLLTHHSR